MKASLVMRDRDGGIEYGKDGKTPKTVQEWLQEQVERKRHWFPPSKGAGADTSVGAGGKREDVDLSDVSNVKDWRVAREKLGMKSGHGRDSFN